jgi:hypothetical protein
LNRYSSRGPEVAASGLDQKDSQSLPTRSQNTRYPDDYKVARSRLPKGYRPTSVGHAYPDRIRQRQDERELGRVVDSIVGREFTRIVREEVARVAALEAAP